MATFLITGPDGKKYRVSGETKEGALAALRKKLGAAPAADANWRDSKPPEGFVLNPATGQMEDMRSPNNPNIDTSAGTAIAQGLGQGVSMGGMDEVVGGLYGLTGPGTMAENYDYATAKMREELARNREANPGLAYGSEIAGAVSLPVGAMGRSASTIVNMGKGAAMGGGLGAVYGFLAGENGPAERAKSALSSGVLGAALGAAGPLVMNAGDKAYKGVERMVKERGILANADSLPQLEAKANALYAQADKVNVPRGPLANTVQTAVSKAERKGMDPDLTPGATKVADRMVEAATSPDPMISFRELRTLREKAAIPAGNVMVRKEASLGTGFINAIDDFVDNVDPALSKTVGEARNLWSRLAKSRTIQEAMDKAQNQASGPENGIRTQFRAILNSPKKRRGFSQPEIDALEAVVQGTPFGNIMRKVGVFGMSASQGGSGLGIATGAGFGGTVGTILGGPAGGAVGAMLPGLIGSGAKVIAERTTRKAAERAQGLIASGMAPAINGMAPATQSVLQGGMMRGLLPFLPQIELPIGVSR